MTQTPRRDVIILPFTQRAKRCLSNPVPSGSRYKVQHASQLASFAQRQAVSLTVIHKKAKCLLNKFVPSPKENLVAIEVRPEFMNDAKEIAGRKPVPCLVGGRFVSPAFYRFLATTLGQYHPRRADPLSWSRPHTWIITAQAIAAAPLAKRRPIVRMTYL